MPIVKGHQIKKKHKRHNLRRRRKQRKGGKHSHRRNISQKGVQGREAYKKHSRHPPLTQNELRGVRRISAINYVLRNALTITVFKRRFADFYEYNARKRVLGISGRDMFARANSELRNGLVSAARHFWEEEGAKLAEEFIAQRAPFTEKELLDYRADKSKIDLPGEFLEWLKSEKIELLST